MDSPRKQIEEQVAKLDQAEILDLAAWLIELARARGTAQPATDLSSYRGILKNHPADALEYQRTTRAEWDRA